CLSSAARGRDSQLAGTRAIGVVAVLRRRTESQGNRRSARGERVARESNPYADDAQAAGAPARLAGGGVIVDGLAIVGVCVAFVAIIGGNFLEGGQIAALLNWPACIIVLGGTLGAVVLQTPKGRLNDAVRMARWVLTPPPDTFNDGIRKML